MHSRLTKSLVATALSAFALATTFGAVAAMADDPPPALSNTSVPEIWGTAQVGSTIGTSDGFWTATTTTDGVPAIVGATPDSFSFQWFTVTSADAYTAIPGATSPTLAVPGFAHTAGKVAVELTAHLDGYEDATAMSAPVTVSPGTAFIWSDGAPSASPVSGDYVLIGSTLTADPGSWQSDGLDLNFTYQWVTAATCPGLHSSSSPIAGETGSTLLVTSDLVGLCIGLVVSATAEGYDGSNSATGEVGIAATVVTGTISGRATNTAGAGVANAQVIVYGSQDYPTTTDANGYYSVANLPFDVYGVRWNAFTDYYGGWSSGSVTLSPTTIAPTVNLSMTMVNRLYGTMTDGDGLGIGSARVYLAGSGFTFTQTTAADGSFSIPLDGYSNNFSAPVYLGMPTCTTVNTAPATPFTIATTGQNVTFNNSIVDATNNGVLQLGQSSYPEIDDITPDIGETVTATTASWNCAIGATYEYQWYRDGVAITTNGTSASYTVVAADGNKHLSVKVWAVTPEFGKRHAATSLSTSAVAVGAAPTANGNPTITWTGSGSAPTFGDTLGVSAITWSVPGGTTTYEWRRAPFNTGVESVVGTGSTYVPPADAAGGPGNVGRDYFTLYITYEVDGYAPATVWTNQVRIDWAAKPVQTSPASVTGTPQIGSTLGFDIGTWDLPDVYVTNSYWTMGPVAGVSFGTLSYASTFTVPATYPGYTVADPSEGSFVNVTLIVTAPGHEPALAVYASSTAIPAPPISTVTPVAIDGPGTVGYFLNPTAGAYSQTPTARDYEWYWSISATGPWTLVSDYHDWAPDLAHLSGYVKLRELVTAADGSTTQSESTPLLIDTDDPTWITPLTEVGYTGTPVEGTTLTAIAAVWDRTGVDVEERFWTLSDGTDFTQVGVGDDYTVQAADVGYYLWVGENATRNGGLVHASHTLIGLVTAAPTTPTNPPTNPPTSTPTPSATPTPSPSATAADDEDATEDDGEESAEPADSPTDEETTAPDGGDSDGGSDSASGSSTDDPTPTSFWSSPGGIVLVAGGALVFVGGLGAAGWWFFIRRPF